MRAVIVIQARMGSTRLPRKVVADLCGRPLLAHVVDRARRARSADSVVVATTVDPEDDAVVALCNQLGVQTVRGSVHDVLSRYRLALQRHHADVVVRVTADCPLLDWHLVDRVVGALVSSGSDYASNVFPPTYPDGYDVEALTAPCLEKVDAASMLAYEREHVTAHVREHPDLYTIATVTCRQDHSNVRLTVDLPEDLERVRRVLSALPTTPPPRLGAVLGLLRRNAELDMAFAHGTRDAAYHAQRPAVPQEYLQ